MSTFQRSFLTMFSHSPRVSETAQVEHEPPVERYVDAGGEPYCYSIRLVAPVGDQEFPELVRKEIQLARHRRRTAMEWKLFGFPSPPSHASTKPVMEAAGFTNARPERLMFAPVTMAAELATRAAGHPGIEVRQVRDEPGFRDFLAVSEAGFGKSEPWVERALLPMVLAGDESMRIFVAYVDGVAASGARLQLQGTVGYLFGGATRPDLRRRGGYLSLVARRMAEARDAGALHVVSDCSEYSEAVLRRIGFSDGGEIRRWWLDLNAHAAFGG